MCNCFGVYQAEFFDQLHFSGWLTEETFSTNCGCNYAERLTLLSMYDCAPVRASPNRMGSSEIFKALELRVFMQASGHSTTWISNSTSPKDVAREKPKLDQLVSHAFL